ncbi:hypothetical protein NLI96_g9833 [Meripilus lineatus]|uniref:Uncharacterized protein n=1 Tax=Meripilus lineatus TaxID=2056292 RepID=A0AAD5UUW1_9APHY|nr:hypothetical protein NLI96_g9833 [Physisporinus lineatus]
MWNELALPRLFRSIKLHSDQDCQDFVELISTNPTIGNVALELEFLPSPQIQSRNLDILAANPISHYAVVESVFQLPPGTLALHPDTIIPPDIHETIEKLVGRMCGVRAFYHTAFWELGKKSPPQLFRNLSTFRSVERLEFRRSQLPMSLLRAYVSAFPSLRSLALTSYGEEREEPSQARLELYTPSLERLCIRNCSDCTPQILSWIASTNSKNTLRYLRLDIGSSDREPSIILEEFLREVGQSLIELDLGLDYTPSGKFDCDPRKSPQY